MKFFSTKLLVLALLASNWLYAQTSPHTYCNNRFGFCVTYPASVAPAEGLPINGDGIILENESKDINVNISGSHNVMDWTAEKIYTFTKEDFELEAGGLEAKVLSSDITADSFDAIFQAGDRIEHSRMWTIGEAFLIITVIAPADKQDTLDELWQAFDVTLDKQ